MAGAFEGKAAVVTGASRGIGKAIALALAAEGAVVVCTSRTTDAEPSKLPGTNDQTVREIEAAGGRGLAVRCDVRLPEEVEALRAATMDAFGRCDILVNNAGISFPGNTLDLPAKRFELVIDVNLMGAYHTFKAFAPHMVEQGGGSILNISSGAAVSVGAGRLSYAVSKAALDKLTTGLAVELKPHDIRAVSLGLELPVLTEGYALVSPGADTTGWESTAIMGEAATWILQRTERYNGRVVTMKQLREDYAAG